MTGLAIGFALAAAMVFRGIEPLVALLALAGCAITAFVVVDRRHRAWLASAPLDDDDHARLNRRLPMNEDSVWARLLESSALAAHRRPPETRPGGHALH